MHFSLSSLSRLAFAGVVLVGSSGANSGQETGKGRAVGARDYAKEGFVIEQFSKDLIFAGDGTWTCDQSAVVRLQSEAGVRQFGVLDFGYNSDSQKIEIAYVRVRKPDGAIVSTPEDSVQDVSSEVSRTAPMYSDLREKQIPVKALGTGDVLEYKLRFIQTKPDIAGQFWYSQNFVTGAVVLEETLRITTPKDKYVKVVSPSVKAEVSEQGGRTVYSWKTAQLEPSAQEGKEKTPAAPAPPSVQLTTFRNWDELGLWYGQLQKARVAVSPAIQAKAAELTKGLTSDVEKQKAIYTYVSTKFRYISVSFGVGRYQPHAAEEVLGNQYGDCKDKHTLFASLLKAAGIEAWPALIGAGMKLDAEMPSPAQFNHVITVIPKRGEYVWLDTTAEVAPYGLLEQTLRDQKALVIPGDGPPVLMSTPADPPFQASSAVEVQSTLSADGTLKAHFDVALHGDDELLARSAFHQIPPAQWQELVQLMIRSLGFAGTVSNVEVGSPEKLDAPFHYSYDYLRTSYSDWSNRRITPPLFFIPLPFGEGDEKPVEPIAMGAPGKLIYRATVRLPKDFAADIPENTKTQTDFAEYSSTYAVVDNVLSAERQMIVKKSKVPVSAWNEYLKFAKKVTGDQEESIQLAASNGASKALVVRNDPEAEALIQQAGQSLQRRDVNAAKDELLQAERLNPKQRNLWSAYATLYFFSHDQENMFRALHKELENFPNSVGAYRALAGAQLQFGHRTDAIETLRTLLKVAPDDVSGVVQLASLLIADKHYAEVSDLVRKALVAAPEDAQLQAELAEALLRDGRKEEGLAAVEKLAKNATDGNTLNSAAWFLVDTNTNLPMAMEYSKKAVTMLEEELKGVEISSLSDNDLRGVTKLTAAWDTLGWGYFQSGDNGKAEQYIDASWRVSQDGIVADHLGQIYARQGKPQQAIRMWQLALAANSGLEETRERLRKAGGSVFPGHPTVVRGAKGVKFVPPEEELGKLRTTDVAELPKQEGSAEFFVLFSEGKAKKAEFINGAEALRPAASALLKANYGLAFPDDGPERIVRRGILSCSTYTSPSCQFVMLLPATTRK